MNSARGTLAIFVAYGGVGGVLNNFHPIMATMRDFNRIYGIVDGCAIISIHTSL